MSGLMTYHAEKIIPIKMVELTHIDIVTETKLKMLYDLVEELIKADGHHIKIDVTFTQEIVTLVPPPLPGSFVFPNNGDLIIRMIAQP